MYRSLKMALWVFCGFGFIALATEPVSIRSQLVIGVAVLVYLVVALVKPERF